MQKRLILLITCLVFFVGVQVHAAILRIDPSGGIPGTKTSLAVAATANDCAGKTIVVTSPQIVTTAIVWPNDRDLKFEKNGYVTFSGSGSLTGLKEARPEDFGATGNDTGNDATAINKAYISASVLTLTAGKTYKVTSPVQFNSSGKTVQGYGTIKGYGAINVVEIGDGSVDGGGAYNGTYVQTFKDFTVVGGTTSVIRGIYARGLRESTISNVKATGVSWDAAYRSFTTAGVELIGCWTVQLNQCSVKYGLAKGFIAYGGTTGNNNIVFNSPVVTLCAGDAYYVGGGGGYFLYAPYAELCGGGLVMSSVSGALVSGGYFERCGLIYPYHIKVYGSTQVSIINTYHLASKYKTDTTTQITETTTPLTELNFIVLDTSTRGSVSGTVANFQQNIGCSVVNIGAGCTEYSLLNNVIASAYYAYEFKYNGSGYPSVVVQESDPANGAVFPLGLTGGHHSIAGGTFTPLPVNIKTGSLSDSSFLTRSYKSVLIPKSGGTKTIDITSPVGSSNPVLVNLSLAAFGNAYTDAFYKTWDVFYLAKTIADPVAPTVTVKNSAGAIATDITVACAFLSDTSHRITITNANATHDVTVFISLQVLGDGPNI